MITILILMDRNFRGRLFRSGDVVDVGSATAGHLIRLGIAAYINGDT